MSLLGDGTKEGLILAGDKLYEEEKLFEAGSSFSLPDVIKNTNKKLSQTLWRYIPHSDWFICIYIMDHGCLLG